MDKLARALDYQNIIHDWLCDDSRQLTNLTLHLITCLKMLNGQLNPSPNHVSQNVKLKLLYSSWSELLICQLNFPFITNVGSHNLPTLVARFLLYWPSNLPQVFIV